MFTIFGGFGNATFASPASRSEYGVMITKSRSSFRPRSKPRSPESGLGLSSPEPWNSSSRKAEQSSRGRSPR